MGDFGEDSLKFLAILESFGYFGSLHQKLLEMFFLHFEEGATPGNCSRRYLPTKTTFGAHLAMGFQHYRTLVNTSTNL